MYRNAIVHWHPGYRLQFDHSLKKITDVTQFVYDPKSFDPKSKARKLELADFEAFDEDCEHIIRALNPFAHYLKDFKSDEPEPFLYKYVQLAIHPNQAVLPLPPTAKIQQPQRPPSQPSALQKRQKPSAKQRRQRALSEAAKREKET